MPIFIVPKDILICAAIFTRRMSYDLFEISDLMLLKVIVVVVMNTRNMAGN